MKVTKNDMLFYLGLILSIWFALTGMVWSYSAALFIAYPFGLLSYLFWQMARKDDKKRNRIIPVILVIGLVLSLTVLVCMLIWG